MIGKAVAHPRAAQHAVDALRTPALEGIAPGVPQPGAYGRTDFSALLGGEQVLPDDVAVSVQRRHVGLDDRAVDRASAGRRSLVPLREVAPEVFQRCGGVVVNAHWFLSLSRSGPINLAKMAARRQALRKIVRVSMLLAVLTEQGPLVSHPYRTARRASTRWVPATSSHGGPARIPLPATPDRARSPLVIPEAERRFRNWVYAGAPCTASPAKLRSELSRCSGANGGNSMLPTDGGTADQS